MQERCDYSLPDPALKEKLWNEIIDVNSKDGLQTTKIKIGGFFQKELQLDLLLPYFDKFYEVVNDVVMKRDREFADTFLAGLSPAFMARDEDKEKFQKLLDTADKEKNFYILFLKQQIEAVDIIQKSRVLCSQ